MSGQPPFMPSHIADLPQGLDSPQASTSTATSAADANAGPDSPPSAPVTPPFDKDLESNPPPLLDERAYEDNKARQARLVMGPPLGEEAGRAGDVVVPGEQIEANEVLLAEYDDDALDLELTHQRIKTLRGLNIQRFRQVERISLRQNLLTSLGYVPKHASVADGEGGQTLSEPSANGGSGQADPEDIDENDDADAAAKEAEFPYADEGADPNEVVYPLRGLDKLEELDLYDNSLKKVKGLEGLRGLKSLDLSFNLLRSIAPLDDADAESEYAYPVLDHLYLIQNKLARIEGVKHRTSLVYLELGGNRIRTIENLPISANLSSLFLGKNKITKIEGLEGLTGLRTLSIQSNRLTKIEGLETLESLEELYLSHNGLTRIEGLSGCPNLTTLDVGSNQITEVDVAELECLPLLEEFWANNNEISALPILSQAKFPELSTLYLEGNPVQRSMATTYVRKITLEMPQLKQVDANFVRRA